MTPPTFPATLFDYNGVLVDDEAIHLAAFRDVLRPLGIDVAEDRYWERYVGFDDGAAFRAILADAGAAAPDERVTALVEAKKPLYRSRAERGLVGFPGAAALVRSRAEYGPVVIVSGALRDEIELGLAVLGVADAVLAIVATEDTTRSKPDPEGYLAGVRAVAAVVGERAAQTAVVIEDSLAGVEAAKSAGLTCVAVAHTHPPHRLEAADLVCGVLSDVTELVLAELFQRFHGSE